MVIVTVGTDELADQFKSLITNGEWGTGSTDPDPTDTALETAVVATNAAVTSSRSGSTDTFTHTMTTSVGNGNTFTEFVLYYADGTTILLHAVGANIIKSAGFEIVTITTITFSRG